MNRTLTAEQVLRNFIGFDPFAQNAATFPPHNIEKIGDDRFVLTLAVAGYARNEIEMYVQNNILTISGRKRRDEPEPTYVHQGIAFRDWDRQFHLGAQIEVRGASLDNGLLTVNLEHRLPEKLRPKLIEIM